MRCHIFVSSFACVLSIFAQVALGKVETSTENAEYFRRYHDFYNLYSFWLGREDNQLQPNFRETFGCIFYIVCMFATSRWMAVLCFVLCVKLTHTETLWRNAE